MKASRTILAVLLLCSIIVLVGFMEDREVKQTHKKIVRMSNPPAPPVRDFVNIMFNLDYYGMSQYASWSIVDHIPNYRDELNFNAIQIYGGGQGGGFDEPLNDYKDDLNDMMNDIDASGLKTFYGRQKIEKLCYAQRLEYEAEGGNNGFSYHRRLVSPSTDNGRTVLHVIPGTHNAGMLCDSIYENIQHSDVLDAGYYGDPGDWYRKPVMRIKSSDFNNSANHYKPVVAVVTKNFDGSRLDSVIINVINFRDGNDQYNGSYLESYTFIDIDSLITSGNNTDGLNTGWEYDIKKCKVDFKVYWFGEIEVWFDKMIVDDEMGNNLFNPDPQTRVLFENRVTEEVDEFFINNNHPSLYTFFADEILYANILSVKRVQELIKNTGGEDAMLSCATTNYHTQRGLRNDTMFYRIFLQTLEPERFQADVHELSAGHIPTSVQSFGNNDPYMPSSWYVSAGSYNTWLQETVFGDKDEIPEEKPQGSFIRQVRLARDKADQFKPGTGFIMQPQIHAFLYDFDPFGEYDYGVREPLNEEIEAQAMISLAHGADGLCWFVYQSGSDHESPRPLSRMQPQPQSGDLWALGMLTVHPVDPDPDPRHVNAYGQDKWNYVSDMNGKLLNWKPDLDRIEWTSGWSVHSEGANHEFVSDIVSIAPYIGGVSACEEDGPTTYTDCEEERYWEMGFFDPAEQSDESKYLMMVNRRCIPEYVESSVQKGDARILKIKFNGASLAGYDNWKLIDVYTNQSVTFNKNYTGAINLGTTNGSVGWFKPGEGKLFKLTPVVIDGGTLVSDEVISGNALISDTVFTDGFNLTIEDGHTLTFDTNGVIIAEGGNFICGDISGTQGVDLLGTGEWNGIKLNACDTVKIYNTSIEDIKDSAYAIDMYNCKNVEMEGNTFTLNNSGAVRGSYVFTYGFFTPTIVLYDNTVNIGANTLPVFNFNANSASSFPVIIDDCDMNAPSSSSSSAINITNITGGVIKNNEITGYNTSVLALSSAMDFYNNIISPSTTDCILSGSSGSTLGLKENGGKSTGGENYFSTSHEDANNVEIYGGYFFAHDGYNTFDIAASYDDGKHFLGYFPEEDDGTPTLEYNCFTEDGSAISPVYDVTRGIAGDPITFLYTYDCTGGLGAGLSSKSENSYLIIPITDRYNDTIKIRDGNFTLTASDSMSVEMRKRNYGVTIDIAERILENSSGNPVAYDALNKLYLASLSLDSVGNRMTPLKAFLEQVILDNGDKPGLVSRTFYFIQKCKAALGQYQSALTGFGDIITNNPNTYDALVASWDYAATALLMNGNGQGGGMPSQIINGQLSIDNNESVEKLYELKSYSDNPDDRSNLSKEQKQQVKVNVVKSFEETRKEEINVINKLKEKSDRGDRNATKELKRRETLQAVVTKRQPADVFEHINNVSSDIRVVFNSTDDNSIKKEQNSVPVEFELSQNFPNPFNPTTKIQYALPKDGKVQLIIYDILGREMAKLVNNEFKPAGRYVSEFNGSRLASGIYFYRIIVNDGKDFNSVKKMVLVK